MHHTLTKMTDSVSSPSFQVNRLSHTEEHQGPKKKNYLRITFKLGNYSMRNKVDVEKKDKFLI